MTDKENNCTALFLVRLLLLLLILSHPATSLLLPCALFFIHPFFFSPSFLSHRLKSGKAGFFFLFFFEKYGSAGTRLDGSKWQGKVAERKSAESMYLVFCVHGIYHTCKLFLFFFFSSLRVKRTVGIQEVSLKCVVGLSTTQQLPCSLRTHLQKLKKKKPVPWKKKILFSPIE